MEESVGTFANVPKGVRIEVEDKTDKFLVILLDDYRGIKITKWGVKPRRKQEVVNDLVNAYKTKLVLMGFEFATKL